MLEDFLDQGVKIVDDPTQCHAVAIDWCAPLGLWSLPRLFGIFGGVLPTVGCAAMAFPKQKSDRDLIDPTAWGGDFDTRDSKALIFNSVVGV